MNNMYKTCLFGLIMATSGLTAYAESSIFAIDAGKLSPPSVVTTMSRTNNALPSFAKIASDVSTDYIKTVPANAVPQTYSRQWKGFWVFNYMVSMILSGDEYERVQYLYFDGDDVYMRMPVLSFEAPGYIKGRKTDKGITFPLPQCVYSYTDYDSGEPVEKQYYVQPLYFDPEFMHYYVSDTGQIESLELTLKEDGTYEWDNYSTITAVDPEDGVEKKFMYKIIGITNQDDEWSGYGDYITVLRPFTDTLSEAPSADATTMIMTLSSADMQVKVNAAQKGADFWVQGLCQYNPEAWAKGSLIGDVLTLPRQYMGIDKDQTYFGYLRGANGEMVWNEILETETLEVTPIEKLEFDYNSSTYTLTARSGISISGGLDDGISIEYMEAPVLKGEQPTLVPDEPVIDKWYDYDPDWSVGSLYVDMQPVSMSGATLDPSRLSWSIDLDWKPYLFSKEVHRYIDEDMTWVPYDYTDNMDIRPEDNLILIRFRRAPEYMVGIRLRYMLDNGTYVYSRTAEVHTDKWAPEMTPEGYGEGSPAEASVKSFHTDSDAAVVERIFTDLTGRRISYAPEHGLYLETVVRADGTKATRKVMR